MQESFLHDTGHSVKTRQNPQVFPVIPKNKTPNVICINKFFPPTFPVYSEKSIFVRINASMMRQSEWAVPCNAGLRHPAPGKPAGPEVSTF